jgi:hypothetical protein
MKRWLELRALQMHGWAQAELLEEFRERAASAGDPRLCSAWIGLFVKLCDALTETGGLLGRLERTATLEPNVARLLVNLRLPKLPVLTAEKEGIPPTPQFPKTTAKGISSPNSELRALGSSPVYGGGGAPKAVEGAVTAPMPSSPALPVLPPLRRRLSTS